MNVEMILDVVLVRGLRERDLFRPPLEVDHLPLIILHPLAEDMRDLLKVAVMKTIRRQFR